MRVVFLGTGGYHPCQRRHTVSVMLPEIGVAFDAGTSFFRAGDWLQTDSLSIFLSHAHLDHIAGLQYLLVPLYNGRLWSVRIHGAAGHLRAVREHLFAPPLFPINPAYDYVDLEAGAAVSVAGGAMRHRPLEHPGGSTGYRLELPGRSLAFITDTTADGSYTDFVRGVDLLIHECNFPDAQSAWARQTGHSHTTPVAELARDAGVGRLVLLHFDPQCQDDDPIGLGTARAIFTETILAEDELVLEW
ncbi:MAG: MBL fold metallo-hydrolase [Planctomycetes bacterium]|nr:MBL fold metallo-hydrolase [Planctomycetota bacterium]